MTCKTHYNRKTLLETKYLSRHLDAAIPLRSADTDLKKTIELQHTTVEHIALMQQFQCTKRLYPTLPCSMLVCSTLLYFSLLCSTSTSALLFPSLVYSTSSTSTLPLLGTDLWASENVTSWSLTAHVGLVRMCLHDLSRHVPTGHSDLWGGRNVTSWSLKATCQLDTMIFGLVMMWLHDLLRHGPTGHNGLWASENVISWSLEAHASWTQWSLG